MELYEYQIITSTRKPITLVPIGDLHIGNKAFDRALFREQVANIKKRKDVYWIGMGDYAEYITINDPRFDAECIDGDIKDLSDLPFKQSDNVIKELKPIRDKCIGLLFGNHEQKLKYYTNVDMHERVCQQLRVRNLGFTCFIRLLLKRKSGDANTSKVVLIYASHGSSSGRQKGGKINRLEQKLMSIYDADIVLQGHSHDKVATTRDQLSIPRLGKLKLVARKTVFAICPSFLRSYLEKATTYSEANEYPPTSMGVVEIIIDAFRDGKHGVDFHIYQ